MQSDTSVLKLNTNLIIPNKYQPRKVFDEVSLNSLAESIKQYGIINPILVRKKDDKYEIIAGERRFRAAQKAGLSEVPVIVKTADEQQMAELALIENIQRQGLSPIEEAKSYEEIMRIGNQTQSSLAEKIGKSQSAIANKIRLLSLPEEIQEALSNKKISERHARALITVTNKEKQLALLEKIMKEKLTVKETEKIINEQEVNEEEIKKAISDIMKSLNIKEEEKEDDNMNGNFFPNFDNNTQTNNPASLNMMNMQSMNPAPMQPENTKQQMPQPQMVTPELQPAPIQQEQSINPFEQFAPAPVQMPEQNVNNNFNQPENYLNLQPMMPQDGMNNQMAPQVASPQPVYEPQFDVPTTVEPQPVGPEVPTFTPPTQMEDIPLFNPNVVMPTQEEMIPQNTFEIPVSNSEPIAPMTIDRLTELQNLLSSNGYNYKVYSNETDDCVIIELAKN